VHRSALDAHETRSAADLLRTQLGAPVWMLHRLDKATSGILAFARSAEVATALGDAFASDACASATSRWCADGRPAEGEIDYPLARDPERPSAGQPRLPAVTRHVRRTCFEWPFPDGSHAMSRYALVDVEPLSGRRHQIRRHFKHIAHPLVGDTTHGNGAHNRAGGSMARTDTAMVACDPARAAGHRWWPGPRHRVAAGRRMGATVAHRGRMS